jgi:hypothetical protein
MRGRIFGCGAALAALLCCCLLEWSGARRDSAGSDSDTAKQTADVSSALERAREARLPQDGPRGKEPAPPDKAVAAERPPDLNPPPDTKKKAEAKTSSCSEWDDWTCDDKGPEECKAICGQRTITCPSAMAPCSCSYGSGCSGGKCANATGSNCKRCESLVLKGCCQPGC